ncbi:hypothetical protein CRV24_001940 [Beauveria bassiana]|nr:hypothetical protein CRV24_001940 [Beauveria bassiana]
MTTVSRSVQTRSFIAPTVPRRAMIISLNFRTRATVNPFGTTRMETRSPASSEKTADLQQPKHPTDFAAAMNIAASSQRPQLTELDEHFNQEPTDFATLWAANFSSGADFVQELYLKELKAYKMPPVKESDSVGQVQTFAEPKTPKSPEEADLASSLQEYESMAVEIEGQDAAQQASGIPAALPDWLEAEEEDAAPKH